MTTTATEQAVKSKKAAPKTAVCKNCKHPKPFHPGSKNCKAYGCDCKRFRVKA